MEIPDTLPARLYLLAYDSRRGRLSARSELPYLIRAGALADLQLRGHLTDEKWIRVETRRLLGLIPVTTVTVRDPRVLGRLATLVRAALSPARPSSQVEPRDAALVALAATAELPTALTRRQRREYRTRIAELADRTGPAVRALRQVYAADAAAG